MEMKTRLGPGAKHTIIRSSYVYAIERSLCITRGGVDFPVSRLLVYHHMEE
jgi:hypothetical protein